jgi:ribosomal protein S28E/S33
MSSCCGAAPNVASCSACPVSGTAGKRVELLTVKGLLRESALVRLHPGDHHFCPEPACDVVYFDNAGRTYLRRDLRVAVWEKEVMGRRMICYCFGENEADIRREFEEHGSSGAVARVRAHIQAGRCACEIRNPRGVCCLGDVVAAIERARETAAEVQK